jgi:hypothetical protein
MPMTYSVNHGGLYSGFCFIAMMAMAMVRLDP